MGIAHTSPTTNAAHHSDAAVTMLAPDVSFQWLNDGRIYLSRLGQHDSVAFDRWDTAFRAMMDTWPVHRLLCVLFDIRTPQFGFSLSEGTQMRHIVNDYLHIHSAVAIVYPNTLRARMLVAPLTFIPTPPHQTYHYFLDYDQALGWLHEQLAQETH